MKAGAEQEVTITVNATDFGFYSVDFMDVRVEAGLFDVIIANNVNEDCLVETIEYVTDKPFMNDLGPEHPIWNYKHFKPHVVQMVEELYGEIPWYDMEQPMSRILWRIETRKGLTKEEYNALKKKVYQK